jgi:replicative DNA helicase
MANLTYRAEQALLGALLNDPDLLEDLRFLTAEDFLSQTHRDIFTAVTTAHAARPDDGGRPFNVTVALAGPGPGFDPRYLETIARSCPQPANAPAYARMVMEARLRRQLLSHADRLFRDAGDLHFEVGRFSQAAGNGHAAERFPSHLMKLAHAMWVHAKGLEPSPSGQDGPVRSAEPATDAVASDPVAAAPTARPMPAAAAGADELARKEEDVLADLIQHPWQNSDVLEWLPADVFTGGARREVYEAITALARTGEPVDELTVEWQLARQRAAAQASGTTLWGARSLHAL